MVLEIYISQMFKCIFVVLVIVQQMVLLVEVEVGLFKTHLNGFVAGRT